MIISPFWLVGPLSPPPAFFWSIDWSASTWQQQVFFRAFSQPLSAPLFMHFFFQDTLDRLIFPPHTSRLLFSVFPRPPIKAQMPDRVSERRTRLWWKLLHNSLSPLHSPLSLSPRNPFDHRQASEQKPASPPELLTATDTHRLLVRLVSVARRHPRPPWVRHTHTLNLILHLSQVTAREE